MLARKRLLGLLSGTWVAQAVYAVVKLGVPDLLTQGPAPAAELARQTGASEEALVRLLRVLCGAGLFTQPEPGHFGLTASGELLRADVPGSVRLNALMQGEEVFRSFAEIMHTVRGNGPAFDKVHGTSFYAYLEEHPEAAQTFNASMGDQQPPAAVDTCDLTDAKSIVDIGGGDGRLLERVLSEDQRAVLLELPTALAAARERLARFGDRVEFVEGSFFSRVPAGGEVYVLSRVLHNWSDANAARILANVREAMPAHGRLIVLEDFLSDSGGGLVDLLMLVTLEGRDRTGAEYERLLAANGFTVTAMRPGVLEACRA